VELRTASNDFVIVFGARHRFGLLRTDAVIAAWVAEPITGAELIDRKPFASLFNWNVVSHGEGVGKRCSQCLPLLGDPSDNPAA